MASPYDVLGVDPDADQAELVEAYRRRVKETHPDRGGSAAAFQRVQTAYAKLQSETASDGATTSSTGSDRSTSKAGQDSDDPASPSGSRTSKGSRVEYLNYDVLVDKGWSLDDPDLFDKAASADLDPADYGRFRAPPGKPLLEAAEERGFAWPYACRGGACSNCAVALCEGEMPTPAGHILPGNLLERGLRLSCISTPESDDLRVVYNVKHLPALDDLLLPASRFRRTGRTD